MVLIKKLLSLKINFKKYFSSDRKGFTLIELMVVVAIIGILAAVVLASLSGARIKGNDAAIKSNLSNIIGQAAIFYDSNGNNYNNTGQSYTCSVTSSSNSCSCLLSAGQNMILCDPNVMSAMQAAAKASGGTVVGVSGGSPSIPAYAQQYTIESPLTTPTASPSTTKFYWCIDSSGASRQITNTVTGSSPFITPLTALQMCPAS